MFRDFLWLLHTKQSYDMQKKNGLAGLIALAAVLLLLFKWNDWFAPLFFGLGLDKIPAMFNADHGDFYALTFIHMLTWVFLISVAIGIMMAIGYILFMTPVVFIFIAPILLVAMLGMMVVDFFKAPFKKENPKKSSPSRSGVSSYEEVDKGAAMKSYVDSLIKDGRATQLESRDATVYLNRATSISEEQPWVIGKDSNNNWFVLGNNPLPVHVSHTHYPNTRNLFFTLRNIYTETKAARQMSGMATSEDTWEHLAGTREMDDYFTKTYSKVDNPNVLKTLCVASLPLSIRLGEGDLPYFHFDVQSEVTLEKDLWDLSLYQIETSEIRTLFKAIVKEHNKFVETIHAQHVAFYAYPHFTEVEYSYLTEGGLGFFKGMEAVQNAKEFNTLYHPHVYTLALEEAHNFKATWAINYLEGYQS